MVKEGMEFGGFQSPPLLLMRRFCLSSCWSGNGGELSELWT